MEERLTPRVGGEDMKTWGHVAVEERITPAW
jgi:hypothetical protein